MEAGDPEAVERGGKWKVEGGQEKLEFVHKCTRAPVHIFLNSQSSILNSPLLSSPQLLQKLLHLIPENSAAKDHGGVGYQVQDG